MKDQTTFWGALITANIYIAPHLSENFSLTLGWVYLGFAFCLYIYEKFKKD